jgi:alpha-ketoglutarate-dependent taurine dioxygenase
MLDIVPTGAALGAEIRGLDVRAMDAATFAAVHHAWLDHQVLLLREQRLTDEDLIRFSRRFGELDHAPIQENGRRFVEGFPEIYVVSNVVENGVAIGSLGAGEAVWHTDMSYLPDPPKASVLYALEVPPTGGDTSFCTMYGAWEHLPDALREAVAPLRVKHDGTYNSGGYVRAGVTASDDPRTAPGTMHPLVCAHRRRSGRTSTWAGAATRGSKGCPSIGLTSCSTRSGRRRRTTPSRGVIAGGRRPRAVGQPLRDAPARRLRCLLPSRDAPHADQGRDRSACVVGRSAPPHNPSPRAADCTIATHAAAAIVIKTPALAMSRIEK